MTGIKGITLRGARRMRDITQQDLAAHLGVTVPTVRKWESDPSSMPVSVARKVCQYLGINPDELFLNADVLGGESCQKMS